MEFRGLFPKRAGTLFPCPSSPIQALCRSSRVRFTTYILKSPPGLRGGNVSNPGCSTLTVIAIGRVLLALMLARELFLDCAVYVYCEVVTGFQNAVSQIGFTGWSKGGSAPEASES